MLLRYGGLPGKLFLLSALIALTSLESARAQSAGRPGSPTNLEHSIIGPGKVTLRWAPPADDGGNPIIGYRIQARLEMRWFQRGRLVKGFTVPNSPTSATISSLKEGSRYHFSVESITQPEFRGRRMRKRFSRPVLINNILVNAPPPVQGAIPPTASAAPPLSPGHNSVSAPTPPQNQPISTPTPPPVNVSTSAATNFGGNVGRGFLYLVWDLPKDKSRPVVDWLFQYSTDSGKNWNECPEGRYCRFILLEGHNKPMARLEQLRPLATSTLGYLFRVAPIYSQRRSDFVNQNQRGPFSSDVEDMLVCPSPSASPESGDFFEVSVPFYTPNPVLKGICESMGFQSMVTGHNPNTLGECKGSFLAQSCTDYRMLKKITRIKGEKVIQGLHTSDRIDGTAPDDADHCEEESTEPPERQCYNFSECHAEQKKFSSMSLNGSLDVGGIREALSSCPFVLGD